MDHVIGNGQVWVGGAGRGLGMLGSVIGLGQVATVARNAPLGVFTAHMRAATVTRELHHHQTSSSIG